MAFLGQDGFQGEDQIDRIAKGTFLSTQNESNQEDVGDMIRQRLGRMEELPEALVQAASPFRLTEFGNVVRKTGLGSTASTWTTRGLQELLSADPTFFGTIRQLGIIDENKLRALIQLTLFEPSNLLDSFGIRAHSKELFGASISKLEQNLDSLLSAFSVNKDVKDAMQDVVLKNYVEFLLSWMNGQSYQEVTRFFLTGQHPLRKHRLTKLFKMLFIRGRTLWRSIELVGVLY